MKKSAVVFEISSLVWGISLLGVIWIFPKAWFFILVVGAALWGWWGAYFKSVSYEVRRDNLRISSGILFRKERFLPFEEILMTKRAEAAGKTLFTVAYFSGGRVLLFADLPFRQ
ncbi:MAG: hypothetical protein ACI4QY_05760 [Oscillospiraceae bacterium]